MKKQERRHFTPEQKSKILREHHIDKVPVSELCERYKLQPSVFYGWQRALFERAPQVFVETSILDGYSRAIIHWDIREAMTERDVECILQRARELHPGARPRVVTDNGPQFIARDFKEFIRLAGMTHVRISPGYPQSNGKIERWHKTFKSDALRPAAPSTVEEARRVTAGFVEHYNARRLHSAIGYIAPNDKLAGRETAIFADRDRKLEAARELRRQRRELARQPQTHHHPTETSPPASP